mgnify:FL=1
MAFKESSQQSQEDFFDAADAIPAPGSGYDLRVYDDGETEWYPYMFGKTFTHDATSGFISKADGDALIAALQAGTVEALDDVPQHPASVRKLEGALAWRSFVARGVDPAVPEVHLDVPNHPTVWKETTTFVREALEYPQVREELEFPPDSWWMKIRQVDCVRRCPPADACWQWG